MTAIWAAGGILLLLVALALAPVRVEAAYADGRFALTGRAGPVPVKLRPGAEDRRPGKRPRRNGRELLRRLPPPVLRLLAESGCRSLGWLVRRVRLDRVRARYTAAGPDPCQAAMAYARAGLVMEGIARMAPDADLRTDVDFDGICPVLEGVVALRMRLGQAVYAAACFGIGFLRGYFRYQREKE